MTDQCLIDLSVDLVLGRVLFVLWRKLAKDDEGRMTASCDLDSLIKNRFTEEPKRTEHAWALSESSKANNSHTATGSQHHVTSRT